MITVQDFITGIVENVMDKKSRVCIQTVRINKDGKPEVYNKEIEKVVYDHKHRRLIIK